MAEQAAAIQHASIPAPLKQEDILLCENGGTGASYEERKMQLKK